MKKLLTSMLILVVAVGPAAAIIKPADIRKAAQLKLSQVKSGTVLDNLERMMGLSLKSAAPGKKFSPEVIAAQMKSMHQDFSTRRTWLTENSARIDKLMKSAYGSHLAATHSNVLTQEQFFDLAILDTYGPNPGNKYFTPIVYSKLDFIEYPFTTTKIDFYVMAHQAYVDKAPVFIPAGSKIQIGGNLVKQNMHDPIEPWIEYVAHVLSKPDDRLYKMADRAHVAKDFDFTGQDVTDLFFSEQADQLFTPIFLRNRRGNTMVPAAFTRIPLRINNSDFPAGSVVVLYYEGKQREHSPIEHWSVRIYEGMHVNMLGVNSISIDELPMEELFTRRMDTNGTEIYIPKVPMIYYDESHGDCMIGPEDMLTVVVEEGEKRLSLPVDAQAMSVDAFKLAMEIPLPAEEELLANLPEEGPFQTFDSKKVELYGGPIILEDPFTGEKKVTTYVGGKEIHVRRVFGDDSPLVEKVKTGWKLTVEDLRQENARLQAKRQGLEGPVVPPFGKTGIEELDAWIAEGKVSSQAETYLFKHGTSRDTGNNTRTMYRVLESIQSSDGRLKAEPGDYLDVQDGHMWVREGKFMSALYKRL